MKEFLKELISFRTVSTDFDKDEFENAANFISKNFENIGFETNVYKYNSWPHVFSQKDFGKEKTVGFVVHYDVVPASEGWDTDPFEAVEKDGKIFGRGSSDDKGGVTAVLHALKELEKSNYNVKVFVFGDEEIGGTNGIRKMMKENRELFEDVDLFFVVDCLTEGIEIGSSGNISGKITIEGVPGHSAYPFKYKNAVEKGILLGNKLMEFGKKEENRISKFRAIENPVRENVWNRFSVTVFHGGTKSNIIPGHVEMKFNWRLIPEDDIEKRKKEFLVEFEKWKQELEIDANVKFMLEFPSYAIEEDNPFVQKLKQVLSNYKKNVQTFVELGTTDGNLIYHKFRKPVIGFGPIDEDANIHGANEFIRIETLEMVRNVLKEFLES